MPNQLLLPDLCVALPLSLLLKKTTTTTMKHQELDLPLLLMLEKTATSTKLQEQDYNLKNQLLPPDLSFSLLLLLLLKKTTTTTIKDHCCYCLRKQQHQLKTKNKIMI